MTRFAMLPLILFALPLAAAAGVMIPEHPLAGGGPDGSIAGTVRYSGEAVTPARLAIDVDADVCGAAPLYDESLLVDEETSGIRNAVVWLEGMPSAGDGVYVGDKPTLDQRGCRYEPHVLIVRTGQELDILNSDGILHNSHTRSTSNRAINKAQPGFLKEITVSFRRPEIIEVRCDAHEWMHAWIVVAEHPFYVVTDQSGRYSLPAVPPGTYTLKVWHESLGTHTAQVTVVDGTETRTDFELSSPPG